MHGYSTATKFVCGINGCKTHSPHRSTIWKHRQKHKVNDMDAEMEVDSDEEEQITAHRLPPTVAPTPTPASHNLPRPDAPFPTLAFPQNVHGHRALDVPFDFRSTDQNNQSTHQQTWGLASRFLDAPKRSVLIPRPLLGGPFYTPGHVECLPRFVPTPPTPPPNARFLFGWEDTWSAWILLLNFLTTNLLSNLSVVMCTSRNLQKVLTHSLLEIS